MIKCCLWIPITEFAFIMILDFFGECLFDFHRRPHIRGPHSRFLLITTFLVSGYDNLLINPLSDNKLPLCKRLCMVCPINGLTTLTVSTSDSDNVHNFLVFVGGNLFVFCPDFITDFHKCLNFGRYGRWRWLLYLVFNDRLCCLFVFNLRPLVFGFTAFVFTVGLIVFRFPRIGRPILVFSLVFTVFNSRLW